MIITTGKPTGYLRTDKQYENFILEFEWFHAPSPKGSVGNSGLFVWGDPIPAVGTGYTRSIEVQVLVNLRTRTRTRAADRHQPGRSLQHLGRQVQARSPASRWAGNAACRARTTARASSNGTTTR